MPTSYDPPGKLPKILRGVKETSRDELQQAMHGRDLIRRHARTTQGDLDRANERVDSLDSRWRKMEGRYRKGDR
jgi:hypothetical protein